MLFQVCKCHLHDMICVLVRTMHRSFSQNYRVIGPEIEKEKETNSVMLHLEENKIRLLKQRTRECFVCEKNERLCERKNKLRGARVCK